MNFKENFFSLCSQLSTVIKLLLQVRGQTKNWIAVEGSLFSSSYHDTSLTALNSKLASSTPLNAIYFSSSKQSKYSFYDQKKHPVYTTDSHADKKDIEEEQTTSSSTTGGSFTEKNVFAIQVSYYAKIKLFLSSIGGDISIKLPFFLGNVEQNINNVEAHQKQEYSLETGEPKKHDSHFFTTNELTTILKENINDFNQSLDSSTSDLEINSEIKKESVVQAQIHERKYLESDM